MTQTVSINVPHSINLTPEDLDLLKTHSAGLVLREDGVPEYNIQEENIFITVIRPESLYKCLLRDSMGIQFSAGSGETMQEAVRNAASEYLKEARRFKKRDAYRFENIQSAIQLAETKCRELKEKGL